MRKFRYLLGASVLGLAIIVTACFVGKVKIGNAGNDYAGVKWQELFNGKDLTGWSLAPFNNRATYVARDGAIVGTTIVKPADIPAGNNNSFLRSDKIFGNFILEYEFKADEGVNSGVQLRSFQWKEYKNGKVHGYQVEIDPSARAWSGGIYDEGRHLWLVKLDTNPAAGAAYKHNDWNKVRVVAIGDHIQTWINGVAASDLHHGETPAGWFGLQVHNGAAGHDVAFRNIRIKDLDRAGQKAGFEGNWKGGMSDESYGLYAKVEKSGGQYTAKIYDKPEMTGTPLAELKGTASGDTLTLSGGDWTGEIKGDSFTGAGKMVFKASGIYGAAAAAAAEETVAPAAAAPAKAKSAKAKTGKGKGKAKAKAAPAAGSETTAAPAAPAAAASGEPQAMRFEMMKGDYLPKTE